MFFEVTCRFLGGLVASQVWVIRADSAEEALAIAQSDEDQWAESVKDGYEPIWYSYSITPDRNPAIVYSGTTYS